MAPREGFEPPTKRLTAACSTTELPRNTDKTVSEFHLDRQSENDTVGKVKKKEMFPVLC